jgi:hypothetical protein
MQDYKEIAKLLNQLPFDVRAEIVAADLIEQGIDAERIIFKPVSLFKRRFSNDVSAVKLSENDDGEQDLHIHVTRDGIYDTIPQGLFHQPKSKTAIRNKSDMVANVKTVRAEEESARRFFQPMENELLHLRTDIERAERKVFFDLEHSETNDLLINFWNLGKYRQFSTLPLLVKLMPVIYRLSGNLDYIKICYELLLRVPVHVAIKHHFESMETSLTGWQLGTDALSFETICSDSITSELPGYEITLGPMTSDHIAEYLPGGKMLPYLHLLNSHFLSAGYETTITILPHSKDCSLSLTDAPMHLGINTALN